MCLLQLQLCLERRRGWVLQLGGMQLFLNDLQGSINLPVDGQHTGHAHGHVC